MPDFVIPRKGELLNKVILAARYSRFGAELGSQTNALLHVDDVAVLSKPVNEGGCQVSVLEKGTPLAKAQIGSEERRLFAMAFVHQGEEKTYLNRFDLYVANFVY
jgi:hypothetical protein